MGSGFRLGIGDRQSNLPDIPRFSVHPESPKKAKSLDMICLGWLLPTGS